MSDNIIQIKNWLRSPTALRGLDRQIHDLSNKVEDLIDSKEQSLCELEEVLEWAVNNKISLNDLRLQSSFEQFVDTVSLEDDPIQITSFETIVQLVEELEEVIKQNMLSLTKKRLEALHLKWQILQENS